MTRLTCRECHTPMRSDGSTSTTLVGYSSPAGHDHDDNCRSRWYVCENGHGAAVSKRNTCPACDWEGKPECFCHKGEKVNEWPQDSE